MKITVVLYDEDGVSQHASGKIDADVLGEYHIIERNKHLYAFQRMDGFTAHFRECKQPLHISEW